MSVAYTSNHAFHCCCCTAQITYALPGTGNFLSSWNVHSFFTVPATMSQRIIPKTLIKNSVCCPSIGTFTWFNNYYFPLNVLNVRGNVSWRKSAMSDNVVILTLMLIYITIRCKGLERQWFCYCYIYDGLHFNTTVHSLQRITIVIIQQKINTNTLVNYQSQAAVEKIQVLPCWLVKSYRCCKGIQCLHLQGQASFPALFNPQDEGNMKLQNRC